ncbi:amino acid permease [Corynebacterium sp. zg912]|uniref:APC family permease n=1 Tax=Corynebacterium wankanglinii TaxID=2735136 RepID=A0A7H0KBN8_9CORY|nr:MULTISPECIES: APC family permease [Corynebacterium]MBA1837452.1 APC family permease [Corynebacterium wankanglinii]MCR5928712.1 amino acid permease [Corynebacterium sp. zg912]QNP94704.1 APC family permease [Corynebacterium wankanglinii]
METPAVPAELKRALRTPSLVVFGLAYMAPLELLAIFGVISENSLGAAAGAYLLATFAMLLTASSYGKMARAYPVSGSAYTYARKAIGPKVGFLSGWAILLDYMFLPLVVWLIGANYLHEAVPALPLWACVGLFVVITSVLNILGVKVADRANLILMALLFLIIIFFVILSVGQIAGPEGNGFSLHPFYGEHTNFGAISAAAIAAYSFLGFDAVTTLTEETHEPQKRIPRAVMLVAALGGVIFVGLAFFAQLVHPDPFFDNPDTAAVDVVAQIGGPLFGAIFIAGVIIGEFASGLTCQWGATRLLYAMGRDNVLPRRFFGQIDKKWQTPVFNTVLTGAVGLIGIFMSVETSTSFINFGAFIGFAMVNLSVIFYWRQHRGEHLNPVSYLVVPALGALVAVFLMTQLDGTALLIGAIWLAVGVGILAKITRGFKVAPPEMAV